MRIISGTFKGKKILEPKDIKTRPLKDLVKESIFNIIYHSKKFSINLEESIVLDLFSGVGSFGVECLSRGAKYVVFYENYKLVLPILNKNLTNLKSINNYEVVIENIYDVKFFVTLENKYNIIFLDPPYKDKNLEQLLNKIQKEKILSENGIIILHRHKSEISSFPESYKIIEQKSYGISKITFLSILN